MKIERTEKKITKKKKSNYKVVTASMMQGKGQNVLSYIVVYKGCFMLSLITATIEIAIFSWISIHCIDP